MIAISNIGERRHRTKRRVHCLYQVAAGEHGLEILQLILPIFGVLLTGIVFAHLKILSEHTADIAVQYDGQA